MSTTDVKGAIQAEDGFTLVELFVVIAVIGVLSALSIETFREYKSQSYDAHATRVITDAQTALQAGLSDKNEVDTQQFYIAWTAAGGALNGNPDTSFVPGLEKHSDVFITINYDGLCDSSNNGCPPGILCCVTEFFSAYHCKGKTGKSVSRWNNGTTMEFEFANPGGC